MTTEIMGSGTAGELLAEGVIGQVVPLPDIRGQHFGSSTKNTSMDRCVWRTDELMDGRAVQIWPQNVCILHPMGGGISLILISSGLALCSRPLSLQRQMCHVIAPAPQRQLQQRRVAAGPRKHQYVVVGWRFPAGMAQERKYIYHRKAVLRNYITTSPSGL